MKIGIIGFGRFGKLITKHLAKDCKVYIHSRSHNDTEIKKNNADPATLKEVCKKDIVIPCVPISRFETTIKKIRSLISHNSIIIDICSVKEYPVKVMKKNLPKKTEILATHPMFGPDSASESLKGRKIVLCKARISNAKYKKIKIYLEDKGLIIIETTPEKHDKDIAKTLILTHFIGRGLIDFGAKDLDIDTEGYKRLLNILDMVQNDTEQLFKDMNRYNRYSKKIRDTFIKSLIKIDKGLER
jgi:prephenate dehydrogenase